MNNVVYVCSGNCQAVISKEQFNNGLTKCGTQSCDMYQKPFEKKEQCDICGKIFSENKIHTH